MGNLFSNQALRNSMGVASLKGYAFAPSASTFAVSASPTDMTKGSPSAHDYRPFSSVVPDIEQQLFEARAQAKIHTSKVAMHMDDGWRKGLYRQLDSLLDTEEWLEGEKPLGTNSFATFLRLMLLVRPETRPGLGLTSTGNLIASWNFGLSRLTVECLPSDGVRYVLSHQIDDFHESSAGDTTVDRFPEVLAPFRPEQWFAHAAN